MKTFGLDIGTTSISAVVLENGAVCATRTVPNGLFRSTPHPYEKIQDVHAIRTAALSVTEDLFALYPDIAAIGVTGQMHGILYLDADGTPVSDLITWQDGRGDLPFRDGESYAAYLMRETGYTVATGYGMVTHFYQTNKHLVPARATVFCTVHDYIAMLLCKNSRPAIDASDAASFGLFDVAHGRFDTAALRGIGLDPAHIPALAASACIGYYKGQIPVFAAIGDNQASFLGAVGGRTDAMLVNIGTGAQFSVYTPSYQTCPGLETRPFPGGGYLLVGSPLCGGRAYALLEAFFRETVRMITGSAPESCYTAMQAALDAAPRPDDLPRVTPQFQGTRADPTRRGEIRALHIDNFTPVHLLWGMLDGMATELYDLYRLYRDNGGADAVLMGSGNGLRRNPHLQDACSRLFGQPLTLSAYTEEAACGAALYAAGQL